ncbi:MFS transporter [Streptomyces sp. RKAG293]|uniref:MFS transporter n=1 Tax=Streptomyces sp. RKAG293 TaxID=2893403 RepID=UPI002556AF38|nr:MFS transporter [Streptomyces sp. RKAG293]
MVPATFVTSLGNNIQLIASTLLLVRANGTMLAVGWLFIAVALPQAVLSPWFGRLADRFDRRRLWLGCDLTSAVAALALPLGGHSSHIVYGSNFALAVVSALFMPTSAALIKERVPSGELRRFNARYEIALQAGSLLSASVGGWAVQGLGPDLLFTFNAATFAVSGLFVYQVGRRPAKPLSTAPGEPVGGDGSRMPVGPLILLYAQGNIVVTVFNALLPILVLKELADGPGLLGIIDAVGGTGFLLAAFAYSRINRFPDLRIALVGYLVNDTMLALQPHFGPTVLTATVFLGAWSFGQARIASRALLLEAAPYDQVGRVFGRANAIGLTSTILVMLTVATLTDHSDTRFGFAALAAITGLTALTAALTTRRTRRNLELRDGLIRRRGWLTEPE